MSPGLSALVVVTALACGVVAGVFFAFSSFVMPALARLEPAQGVAAMQSINRRAVTPAFMAAFMGSAVLCLATGAWALADRDGGVTGWLVGGAAVHLVGCIVLTIGFHVPRNDALAPLDPAAPATREAWSRYLRSWTAGNHVRCLAALAACAALVLALVNA